MDDGTSNAYLTCTGDAQVRTLLDLNTTQWKALEQGAMEKGELHLNTVRINISLNDSCLFLVLIIYNNHIFEAR